jgi:hypothetical protein
LKVRAKMLVSFLGYVVSRVKESFDEHESRLRAEALQRAGTDTEHDNSILKYHVRYHRISYLEGREYS